MSDTCPLAVGDGNRHLMNVYSSRRMSSLFEVDPATLDVFPTFKPWTELVEKVEVETRKLDDMSDIETIDYLKIDVQGSELSVFQSGRVKLAAAVAIQTEVSFLNL
jgi:FkbM family methyltransferase